MQLTWVPQSCNFHLFPRKWCTTSTNDFQAWFSVAFIDLENNEGDNSFQMSDPTKPPISALILTRASLTFNNNGEKFC